MRRVPYQAAVIVLAKSPVAGQVKTRLCPPCTPEQAAAVAEAALRDTLAAVAATPAFVHVLALDGPPLPWLDGGFRVIGQRPGGLDRRLAGVFEDVPGPALVIGMDTPQVTPDLLGGALEALLSPGVDAVLGPAGDGGYWCVGLRRADPAAFLGVPMSTARTGAAQLARLESFGWRVTSLETLDDVDDFDGALAVSALVPDSRFASVVRAIAAAIIVPDDANQNDDGSSIGSVGVSPPVRAVAEQRDGTAAHRMG